MKKIIILVLLLSSLVSCDWRPNSVKIASLNHDIDSLTKVRDLLLVEEKKLDSQALYFYYCRTVDEGETGIFWSSQIYHSGEFIKGPFDSEDESGETVVEILSEGKRIKKFKP